MNSKKQLMNRTKAISTLTATLISTIAFSASVYASDQKSYTGSTCDAPDQTQGATLRKTDGGTLSNTSDSSTIRYVVCPIVRDNVNSNVNPPRAFIRIQNTKNVTTTCWFEAFNSDGGYYDINSDSFAGVGTRTLSIPLVKTTRGGDPYQIQCSLPPRSSIVLYNVVESD